MEKKKKVAARQREGWRGKRTVGDQVMTLLGGSPCALCQWGGG